MRLAFAFLALIFLATPALAQEQMLGLPPRAAPTTHVEVQQLGIVDTTPKFDAGRATTAYLARVSGTARAKSDAYFEGGYWLTLVDTLWALAISGTLLWLGLSAGLRDAIARRVLKEWLPASTVAPGFHIWLPLPAGRTLTALVTQAAQADITLAPSGALQRMDGATVVFVADDGVFTPRPVTIGRLGRERAEVSAGLRAGERVAAANSFLVKAELEKGSAGHDH